MIETLCRSSIQYLLDQLRNFNNLTPDKKQKVRGGWKTYEHLPPEEEAQANTLFRQYQDSRRPEEPSFASIRKLRKMSPDQRPQYLDSGEFRSGFNDEERDLLRGMAELYPSQVR